MERDFLGLNSKDSVVVVKEEPVENCKDSAFSKVSAVQWPSSNKVSALPHFMSFQVSQEEKTAKVLSDPFMASGFNAISTADAFEPTHKRQSGEIQKNINHDKQDDTHFSMTNYPMQQQNAHSMHLPRDVKMLPVSSTAVPISMSNPFFKTHFAGAGQNFGGASIKQQFLGGIPVTVPHSIQPSGGSVVGITEPWFNLKPSGAPAQLTIFYAGAVNVFDDITPEKAQAIMFLAGNGASAASNMAQPRAQASATKLPVGDSVFMNQRVNTSPCSALSSPMSVSSHPIGGATTNNDDVMPAKTTGVSTCPVTKVDPPKTATSPGPVDASNMIPSAVPQARKASLARFLEKRKERAMSLAPYNQSNKSLECGGRTLESSGIGFSATSGMGTVSLSNSIGGE